MVTFYELWNPALSEGSESKGRSARPRRCGRRRPTFVRGHEKWKHPYYWAAWVLWGLP